MKVRTAVVTAYTEPHTMLEELNRAWAEARIGRATRHATIVRYVRAGMRHDGAVSLFDQQWALLKLDPLDPHAGDIGIDEPTIDVSGST